jgi:hypothetical protein
MRLLARWGPLVAALAALALALAVALPRALALTDGHLTYALDDPYIHMAMAKNLAEHGVWGVTRYGFTAASSSPLWTLGLAILFRVLGPREWLPFVLDALAAAAILVLLHESLARRGAGPLARLGWTLAVLAMTPLTSLVFCGLEHLVHLLVLLAFLLALVRELEPGEHRDPALPVLAAALTAIRYEGLFTIALAVLVLLLARRLERALVVGLAGGMPPLAFGLYSLAHGGALLPNSILLKGNAPHAGSAAAIRAALGGRALHELLATPALLVLALGLAAAWLLHRALARGPLRGSEAPAPLVLGTMVIHLQLAQTGWFYRYEAYLIGASLAALAWMAPWLHEALRRRGVPRPGAWMLLLALIGVAGARPLLQRARASYRKIPAASANIWRQQVQMGRFARIHEAGRAVALDDIGAVTFLADIRCLDLVGLADLEVLRLRDAGRYDARVIDSLVIRTGVRTAIVYEKWFTSFVPGGVPAGWTRVGVWRTPEAIVTYSDSVSFFATRREEVAPLTASLRAFAPQLPREVSQGGPYVLAAGASPGDAAARRADAAGRKR